MKADIIHRADVVRAIPGMTIKGFCGSHIYLHWLKSHEIRLTRKSVYYPRDKVNFAFKMERIPVI